MRTILNLKYCCKILAISLMAWSLSVSLSGPLSAAEPMTSLSYETIRNDTNIGGSTHSSVSHDVYSTLGFHETQILSGTNFDLTPGLQSIIIHPGSITDLTGIVSGQGSDGIGLRGSVQPL